MTRDKKDVRISMRVPKWLLLRIDAAAKADDQTRSAFMLGSAVVRAHKIIKELESAR